MAKNKRETYGVVRLDNVRSVYTGHIFSVIGEEDEILENGMVGTLGELRSEGKGDEKVIEREVRSLEKPEGNEEPLVLVAHPEINYNECTTIERALEYFFVPEGTPARAYALEKHDVFSVSKKMVKADDEEKGAQVGSYVQPQAGERILEETSAEPDGAFIGKVVRRDTLGTTFVAGKQGMLKKPLELVVIEVLKNSL